MTPAQGRFQAYGEAVCAFLSHATRREKAAVRQELMDHLTDHAEALLDAGCPPETAETRALAAMGEAREVGRALNRAFPLRWLVLSRLALAALVALLALVVWTWALPLGEHLQAAWAIRQDPLHNYHTTFLLGEEHTLEDVTPLEGQTYPLPDGSTLVFYGACPAGQEADTSYIRLLAVRYHDSLWTQGPLTLPTLTLPGQEDTLWAPSHAGSYGVYGAYEIPLGKEDTLTLEYNHFGTTFPIHFSREEVCP